MLATKAKVPAEPLMSSSPLKQRASANDVQVEDEDEDEGGDEVEVDLPVQAEAKSEKHKVVKVVFSDKEILHLHYTQSWKGLEVRIDARYGRGIFSLLTFATGQIVADYWGWWMSADEVEPYFQSLKSDAERETASNYLIQIIDCNDRSKVWYVAAHENIRGRIGRLINHSAIHPNVKPVMRYVGEGPSKARVVLFEATCRISPGDQLLYNYRGSSSDKDFFYFCFCSKCKGVCFCPTCRMTGSNCAPQLDEMEDLIDDHNVDPDISVGSLPNNSRVVECSIQAVIKHFCVPEFPNRPFIHPNNSTVGSPIGLCAVRAIVESLILCGAEPRTRRAELTQEVKQFLFDHSGDTEWFSVSEILLYLFKREPFTPFVLITATSVTEPPIVVAVGANEHLPSQIAVVVVDSNHVTYAVKPCRGGVSTAMQPAVVFGSSVNDHMISELPTLISDATEVNEAKLAEWSTLSAEQKVRRHIEDGHYDPDSQLHRQVLAQMNAEGLDPLARFNKQRKKEHHKRSKLDSKSGSAKKKHKNH